MFKNRVRLPFELSRPQFIDERDDYRKANGETVTLSVIIRKVYEGVTDRMPEKLHERLKIALAHDDVQVEGDRYVGVITQDGSYDIEWPDFKNKPIAMAKFKANVSPFNASNSNCGTCEEFTQVVTEDDDLGSVNEGDVLTFDPLENDSICCNPVNVTIVTINSDYVASASVNPVNNFITLTLKTPLPPANGITLASYRAECQNGQFDESNIIADVDGSLPPVCLAPTGLFMSDITTTTAKANWSAPTPAPASYDWVVYDVLFPGVDVAAGNTTDTFVDITGLTEQTSYIFYIRSNCGSTQSNYISVNFLTLAEDSSEFCGSYTIQNTTGAVRFFNYITCSGDTITQRMAPFQTLSICALQTSPGSPVEIDVPLGLTVTYNGLC